jgi:hypothetical protein
MRLARPTSFLSVAALAAFISLAPATLAQSNPTDADRATARQLGQEGFAALDAKDYKTAQDRLRRADQLVHAPTLLLGLARAFAGERKFVRAQESYQRIIREGVAPGAPEAFKQALEAAKAEVGAIMPLVGGVNIIVTAAGGLEPQNIKVNVDEVPINAASLGVRRAIDPGEHVLIATADGYKQVELKFTVPEGGSVDVPVALEKDPNAVIPAPTATGTATGTGTVTPPLPTGTIPPPPPPPPESPSIAPWIVMGIGGVGLVTGAITGGIALGDHGTLNTACGKNPCPQTESGELSSYHTVGGISTAAFIVGGVGVAAGVVLLLIQPKATVGMTAAPRTGFQVTPVVGPGSLGAIGTF